MSLRTQNGLTLIEVLIAIVVISVGLLGVAGLQLAGLRFNQVASTHSTAAVLVNNMAAAMRANYAGVTGKDYLDAGGGPIDTTSVLSGGAPAIVCRSATDNCNGAAIAKADLWQWSQNVKRLLPNGVGTIRCNLVPVSTGITSPSPPVCVDKSSYTIKVQWDEDILKNASPPPPPKTFQTVFQP